MDGDGFKRILFIPVFDEGGQTCANSLLTAAFPLQGRNQQAAFFHLTGDEITFDGYRTISCLNRLNSAHNGSALPFFQTVIAAGMEQAAVQQPFHRAVRPIGINLGLNRSFISCIIRKNHRFSRLQVPFGPGRAEAYRSDGRIAGR
ncbi:hypothetical protein D3C75_1001910 [compost metagenome]